MASEFYVAEDGSIHRNPVTVVNNTENRTNTYAPAPAATHTPVSYTHLTVAYYRVVLERDLLLQESNEQEMTSLKIDILDNAVEIYIILGFLEAQLKKESEELNRSAGIIEKVQQIQFKIRKTKMDLSDIRREKDSAEAELFNSIAERSTSINYDKGTI